MRSIEEILRTALQEIADKHFVRVDRVSVDWIGTGGYRDWRVYCGHITFEGQALTAPKADIPQVSK